MHSRDDVDPRIAEILDDYFEKLQSGHPPDVESLLQAHPDIAEDLRSCLDGIHVVHTVGNGQAEVNVGSEILGDFRILREVGRGGMGVVYEAEQISLRRRVALKVLRFHVADPEAMERFRREAETVANLHHSNIVPIYAVGEANGVNYFAMQFIEGRSLADVHNQATTSIDPMEIADWGLQAAEALKYAHEHEVIHRDVKPSNLIRDSQGRIWLTDFGLAKRLDDVNLSMTGAIMGTPRYMSPEQACSVRRPVDHRTDIYSLGVTLYELATGQPLFEADTPIDALGQIISHEPKAPRTIRPNLPRDLETIIMRCLSKDAEHRYESAAELVKDLRAYLDGHPIHARRPSWVELFSRWLSKNQRVVSAATIAATIAGLLIVGSVLIHREYRVSQLGHIRFASDEGRLAPLIAEVLHEDGSEVVPSFTVPTQHPVPIPQGEYELRLRAPGELGDTMNFSVRADRNPKEVKLKVTDRNLWPPLSIARRSQFWNREDGADLLVFTGNGISLFDGATSRQLWSTDLKNHFKQQEYYSTRWDWWNEHGSIVQAPSYVHFARVASTDADLDSDGIGDLVFACHFRPWIIALSGRDGSVLWTHVGISKQELRNHRIAGSFSSPLVAHVDDDQIPDFVAGFVTFEAQGHRSFLRAVSGASGEIIWEHKIDPAFCNQSYRSAQGPNTRPAPFAARWHHTQHHLSSASPHRSSSGIWSFDHFHPDFDEWIWVPFQPCLDHAEDPGITLVAGQHLLTLSVESGEVKKHEQLPTCPVRPPHWLDIDQDGTQELLICSRVAPQAVSPTGKDHPRLELTAWDPQQAKARWRQTVDADWEWLFHVEQKDRELRKWPLVEDLDLDGKLEIITAGTNSLRAWNETPYGTIQVLDAATGAEQWQSQPIVNVEKQLNHFLKIDDIDGDGTRDLAVVTMHCGPEANVPRFHHPSSYIFVDIVSGESGATIDRIQSRPLSKSGSQSPHLYQVREQDGLIVVELRGSSSHVGSQDHLLLFDILHRKHLLTSDDLTFAELVDLDGDDRAELTAFTANQERKPNLGGKLSAWKIQDLIPGGVWIHADQYLTRTGDVNGDGIEDAMTAPKNGRDYEPIRMMSGRTGEPIWTRTIPSQGQFELYPVDADFNEDGISESIAVQWNRRGRQMSVTAHAISGESGNSLWQQTIIEAGECNSCQVLDTLDLDNDGKLEMILLAQGEPHSITTGAPYNDSLWLFCLEASNGRIRWQSRIVQEQRSTHLLAERLHHELLDVDQDGTLDLICQSVVKGALVMSAWNGKTGQRIWTDAAAGVVDMPVTPTNFTRYPHFCVIDCENPKVVAIQCEKGTLAVQAFEGDSGLPAWEWLSDSHESFRGGISLNEQRYGNPVPLKFRTPNGPLIGWLQKQRSQTTDLVFLDPEFGQLKLKRTVHEVDDLPSNVWYSHSRLWAVDIDGDGFDEAVYNTSSHLVAYSLVTSASLWKYKIGTSWHRIQNVERLNHGRLQFLLQVREDGRAEDPQTQRRLVAINESGKKAWSVEMPQGLNRYVLSPRILQVLHSKDGRDKVLLWDPDARNTTCRLVDNVPNSVGRSLLEKKENSTMVHDFAITNGDTSDPRNLRRMHLSQHNSLLSFTRAGVMAILLFVLPLLYLRHMVRFRWTLRTLLALPMILGIVIMAIRFPDPNNQSGYSDVRWNLEQAIPFSLVYFPLVVFAVFTWNAVAQRKWRTVFWLIAGVSLMTGLVAIAILTGDGYFWGRLPIHYPWTDWAMCIFVGLQFLAGLLTIALLLMSWAQWQAARISKSPASS